MKYTFDPQSLSYYLAFRYLPKSGISWIKEKNIEPLLPEYKVENKIKIKNAQDIIKNLSAIAKKFQNKKVGILLSSGIDSAIIASFLPKHTQAYTIKFLASNAVDESSHAAEIARFLSLDHHVVDLRWQDYLVAQDKLMLNKKAPLHPAEIAIYFAALQAKKDGVTELFVGSGADATFGGMDKLLSKDWGYQEFIDRYNFITPKNILQEPMDITEIYDKYKSGNSIDVQKFIKEVFGLSTEQMFKNAIEVAGCNIVAPFEEFILDVPLDIKRIRQGEPKYILREVYQILFPSLELYNKIPFARPMQEWMSSWQGLNRPEFRKNIDINSLTGEQKWLLYSLEMFMNLVESEL